MSRVKVSGVLKIIPSGPVVTGVRGKAAAGFWG